MFIKGTYTAQQERINYSTKLIKLMEHFKFKMHNAVSNTNIAPQYWLEDETTALMWDMIKHKTQDKRLEFRLIKRTTTKEMIANDVESSPSTWTEHYVRHSNKHTISFTHVSKNAALLTGLLDNDTSLTDIKGLSLVLQEARTQQVRAYKLGNCLNIVTSEYSWEILRKVIALAPQVFGLELTDLENQILKAYGQSDFNAWLLLIEKYYKDNTTLEDIEKERLKEFFKTLTNYNKENAKERVELLKDKITTLENKIRHHLKALDEAFMKAAFEETKTFAEDTIDFIHQNKAIRAFTIVDRNTIELSITTPLQYYEIEVLEKYLRNKNSLLWIEERKRLIPFLEAMLDEKYVLWTETQVVINITEYDTYCRNTGGKFTNYIGQPHLTYFNCWGNNKSIIQKALSQGDIIGAVAQIIGATQNWNLLDGVVTGDFLSKLLRTTTAQTIQDLETKEFYTLEEVLARETNNNTPEPEAESARESNDFDFFGEDV